MLSSVNNISSNSINKYQLGTSHYHVSMTAKPDEFVKSDEDNKKSSKKKIAAIAGGVVALGGIVAAAILCKGKTLQPANFAEHIEFVKANTMEDAAEFAKKHLGIKKFSLGDDVELANWVLEGLVKINNRFKGKANMPKKIIIDDAYFKKNPDTIAYHNGHKHTIAINKKYFDGTINRFKELLKEGQKALEKRNNLGSKDSDGTITTRELALSVLGTPIERIDSSHFKFVTTQILDLDTQKALLAQVDKFKNAPEKFSRFDAANAIMMLQDLEVSALRIANEPLTIIKNLFKDVPEIFAQKGKTLEYYSKLTKEQQTTECINLMREINKSSGKIHTVKGTIRGNNVFYTIWHEMGHLLHDMNTALKDSFWGVLSKKSYKEFKNDSNKQRIAGIVSLYGQTNPREFVAECFQAMCAGKKLPDEVMKLYKFYKGPMLPAMEAAA